MRLFIATTALLTFASGCGDNSSGSSDCSSGCLGFGFQSTLTNGSNEIEIPDSGENQKYVVTTYLAGNSNIDGTTDEVLGSVEFSNLEVSAELRREIESTTPSPALNFTQTDHIIRHYLNRVQRPEIKSLLPITFSKRSLLPPATRRSLNRNNWVDISNLERFMSLRAARRPTIKKQQLEGSACPDSLDLEFIGVNDVVEESDYLEKQSNGDEFCLIVLGEDSKTVESLDDIKRTIANSIGIYKLIYETDFEENVDGFDFKPVFVLLPFDSDKYWPLGKDTLKGVTGAYFHQISDDNGQPVLVLPTDINKVNSELEGQEAIDKFHATISHELHHAVLDYYRYWVNGDQEEDAIEIGSIDEGLAHYMEDLNGYGQDTFSSFAEPFLQRFASNPTAIFDNNDTPINRGAAQTLLYYLVSQKGGVTFKDGSVDTDTEKSPGILFIRDYVKGKYHGTEGLFSAFGKDKTQTLGHFIGALSVDGGSNITAEQVFRAQDPISDVTSASGQNNKTFGMKFNNFGNVPDVQDRISDYETLSGSSKVQLKYYLPAPLIYTTKQAGDKITINVQSTAEGIGASIIRIQ